MSILEDYLTLAKERPDLFINPHPVVKDQTEIKEIETWKAREL